MNKKQKEVEKAKLAAEAQELKELKAMYEQAAEDIVKKINISNGKIEVMLENWDNLSDDDKSVFRSQIYQKNFQRSLLEQINSFLEDLKSGQFKSIDEYLKACYEMGYIGAMYDIAGQGIPLIIPIDQQRVIKAIHHNSKLKKDLYEKLGEDVDSLKKRIASTISRGIATSDSYENIARNIESVSKVSSNNAIRIARTEGHRIHSNSAHDAQLAAKDAGADIVRQWDSTMDGNTRTTHRLLDGQIREVEEPFEMGGMKAMYPSDFGRPEEDINCRCTVLQRATWALDDDELETLKEKAKFHEIYVEDDFKEGFKKQKDIDLNTFKKRYLKANSEITLPTKTVITAKSLDSATETGKMSKAESFTPATTIEEAEKYAKEVLGLDTLVYIEEGFSVEFANTINKSIAEVYDEFGDLHEMDVLKGIKLLEADSTAYAEYGELDNFIYVQNLIDIGKVKELTEACFEVGYWSTGVIEHVVRHELGHAIRKHHDITKLGKNKEIAEIIEVRLSEIRKNIGITEWSPDDDGHFEEAGKILSYYGLKNVGEFISEAVAEYMAGSPRDIAQWVVDMIRKETKI